MLLALHSWSNTDTDSICDIAIVEMGQKYAEYLIKWVEEASKLFDKDAAFGCIEVHDWLPKFYDICDYDLLDDLENRKTTLVIDENTLGTDSVVYLDVSEPRAVIDRDGVCWRAYIKNSPIEVETHGIPTEILLLIATAKDLPEELHYHVQGATQ